MGGEFQETIDALSTGAIDATPFFPSPLQGEDEGEGPYTARYSARDSGFCSPRSSPLPCKGEDEGEGPCTARYSARDSGFCSPRSSPLPARERKKVRVPVQRAIPRAFEILFSACLVSDPALANIHHHAFDRIIAAQRAPVAARADRRGANPVASSAGPPDAAGKVQASASDRAVLRRFLLDRAAPRY